MIAPIPGLCFALAANKRNALRPFQNQGHTVVLHLEEDSATIEPKTHDRRSAAPVGVVSLRLCAFA
jgi:hypothetical protein